MYHSLQTAVGRKYVVVDNVYIAPIGGSKSILITVNTWTV